VKRLDLIIGEIADQLIENTYWGGVRKWTYYRHPHPWVISKFSLKHKTRKSRRAELIRALKSEWLQTGYHKACWSESPDGKAWVDPRDIRTGVRRYLARYRKIMKLAQELGIASNCRPDELPEGQSIYVELQGVEICKKRIGIHLLNPTKGQIQCAIESAESRGIEAVYVYRESESEFSGSFVRTEGLAFGGTFTLTETKLNFSKEYIDSQCNRKPKGD